MKNISHPVMLKLARRTHKLSKALAEFTTFVIDKYDTPHQSAKNQILVKGVFSGASCGSLVDYAKEMLLLAQERMSLAEISELEKRRKDDTNINLGRDNESPLIESDKEKIVRLEVINANIVNNLKSWKPNYTPQQMKFIIRVIVDLLEKNQ